MWKFHDFSIRQVLCEIKFGDCRNAKSAIFYTCRASEFWFLWNFALFQGWNLRVLVKYTTGTNTPTLTPSHDFLFSSYFYWCQSVLVFDVFQHLFCFAKISWNQRMLCNFSFSFFCSLKISWNQSTGKSTGIESKSYRFTKLQISWNQIMFFFVLKKFREIKEWLNLHILVIFAAKWLYKKLPSCTLQLGLLYFTNVSLVYGLVWGSLGVFY